MLERDVKKMMVDDVYFDDVLKVEERRKHSEIEDD